MRDDVTLRRRIGWITLILGALLLGVLAWAVVAVLQVRESASSAAAHLGQLRDLVTAGPGALPDVDRARADFLLTVATEETAAAEGWANALPIRIGSVLPGISDDALALRQLTAGTGTAVREALPGLLSVSETLTPQRLHLPNGGIDTAALVEAAPEAASAANAARRAEDEVADVPVEKLAAPLRDPATRLQRGLGELREQTQFLSDALAVVPTTLGHNGRREYLLAFQNLAEARPTGGIVGAWALLAAEGGKLELVTTGANDDLRALTTPVRDLGPEMRSLYGADVELSQNVNLSPHFPDAAVLLSDLWQAQGRDAPDGVIAIDPVALRGVLQVTGPLDVSGGQSVNADTVINIVQERVYADYADQDDLRRAYLNRLTATVFEAAVRDGIADPAMFRKVAEAARSKHLMMWFSDEEPQRLIEDADVGGSLDEPATDRVGVYVTNVDASKLDHYLRIDVSCGPDEISLRFTNGAPAGIPAYAQSHVDGLEPTAHRILVDVLLPPSRGVQQLAVDGEPAELSIGILRTWTVARRVLDIPRDETVEMQWLLNETGATPGIDVQPLTVPAKITRCSEE